MSTRTVPYLVQMILDRPVASRMESGQMGFDLGQVGAVGIKELIESYNSGTSIASLLVFFVVVGG